MVTKNLLLSGGEKLVGVAEIARPRGDKTMPYSFDEVRDAIRKPLQEIRASLREVPRVAKPRDEGVFEMVLHPSFLARSYYPSKLLRAVGLRDIGSKERIITPRVTTDARYAGKPHVTASLFVAGTDTSLARFADVLSQERRSVGIERQVMEIETIRWIDHEEKLKGDFPEGDHLAFEVALHAGADADDILVSFQRYAKSQGATADVSRKIRVGGLTFVPVFGSSAQIRSLADFTFLRVARLMPVLRTAIPDMVRTTIPGATFNLPTAEPLHPSERAAIFDGGLGTTDLAAWATEITYPETAATAGSLLLHGSEVTSSFLFGRPGRSPSNMPYMGVDHFRVLAPSSGKDPDLFDVLLRIKQTLETGRYRFANFSLGPHMPIDDDEVHTWTATLDQLCATYDIVATVAVGNDGIHKGANRIQPPGDMVNAIAVGACDSPGARWRRAPYSCVGPGRSPGFVKPDGVAFGGSDQEPFEVYSPILSGVSGVQGTSYAAPLALRTAAGIAATTTHSLTATGIKALLIHHAKSAPRLKRSEVGWGRFPEDVASILECGPGSATVIFNASLAKGEYRRCPVPFPDVALNGPVHIRATFCLNAHTDPEHAINYTRTGIGVVFRPRLGVGEDDSTEFFSISSQYKATEHRMRTAAHKWETVLHRDRRFEPPIAIAGPVFDVEYHARAESRSVPAASAPDVDFALVVTVAAPAVPNLYDLIRQKFPVLLPVGLRVDVDLDV